MKNKILVIEDDRAISELLCMNLTIAGYETIAAYDGIEAQRLLLWNEDADLAVVDIMLPGKDGFALMEDFRAKNLPVIYLTAKDDVASKVKGLKLGAEDYMVKPFEMLELLVRIEKILERTGRAKRILTVKNIQADLQSHQILKDGIPVNLKPLEYDLFILPYLPYDELSRPWIDEDDNFHEAQCKGWDNESLTMVFCSGTLQSFDHSDPIEVSDASDEAVFLLPFDEIKDIFEKTITMQIMTEQENRLLAVDGISFTRYPSIDAQTVEMTITKVQLGYMRVRKGSSSTEGSLIPVWDFYGTWNSQEPVYADGGDEMVIDSVTMDRIGVPLLTIDAQDGSIVQRVQNGPSSGTFPGGVGECE